jgi:hypothetical protein
VPFGYQADNNGKLSVLPSEYATIKEIFQLRREGLSLRKIASILDARGVPTKMGKQKWSHNVVLGVLSRRVWCRRW